jgi:hypothetical protein
MTALRLVTALGRDALRLAAGAAADALTVVALVCRLLAANGGYRCPHLGGRAPCPPLCAETFFWQEDPAEEGRRLASQREDLITQGVDPADLLVPLHPADLDHWVCHAERPPGICTWDGCPLDGDLGPGAPNCFLVRVDP